MLGLLYSADSMLEFYTFHVVKTSKTVPVTQGERLHVKFIKLASNSEKTSIANCNDDIFRLI
jgi:hypothetical protein